MSAARRWSISGRLTRWFAISTMCTALAVAAISTWFLRYSLEREVSALIEEEFEELCLLIGESDPTPAEFAAFSQQLARHHPANPLAFRVWRAGSDEVLGDFGMQALLTDAEPAREATASAASSAPMTRWRTFEVDGRWSIGVVVDGTAQLSLFRRYWLTSLGLVGIVALASLTGFVLVLRKAKRLLEEVGERARTARWRTSDDALQVEDAPDEIRDISEALMTMRANILQQAERNRLLASGMAHELGSPIQNLVMQSEVALMRERTADELRQLLQSQVEELRDLAQGVGNLLALCTIDAPVARDELEEFDLAQELDLRLRRERAHAVRRDVVLDFRHRGELSMRGDREALTLAVCNLVSNAIDWSPPGGRVELTLTEEGDSIEVLVDDGGPGIPSELREQIFQPFFRGPTARGRRAGYGLGLSIARKAVEAHAGSISVDESRLGGARMRITLPRAAA